MPDFDQSVETRAKFVNAWNETLINIWREKIVKLKVVDTGALYRSVKELPVQADGRFVDLELSQQFPEYGLWADLGTGREIPIGNPADVKVRDPDYRAAHRLDKPRQRGPKWGGGMTSGNPREPRPWEAPKYYGSVMALSEFMAESIGDEFRGLVSSAFNSDSARRSTDYYRRRALSELQ